MLSYSSQVSTVTSTAAEAPEQPNERTIRRLRLTLHPSEIHRPEEECRAAGDPAATEGSLSKRKRSGYARRERPVGAELPLKSQPRVANGAEHLSPPPDRPKIYAVVQRTGADSSQEVKACEWPVDQLRNEVNYIREVRKSLEKVKERMSGQFSGTQQMMQKLSQEMRSQIASSNKRNQKADKPLLDRCVGCTEARSEMGVLRSSWDQAEERLREMDRKLSAAQTENHTLRLQVESAQDANSQALLDLTQRLQSQYEVQLQEQEAKYRKEITALKTHLDECIRRAEEAERKVKLAEAEIAEKDRRVHEVERLMGCMGQERKQLEGKLRECEERLQRLQQVQHADAATIRRSRQLEEEAAGLKERIKHLNDMVFSQQKKVKSLIQQIEALKAKVEQKEQYITELLDRIAIVECENNELEDKLKYYTSLESERQNQAAVSHADQSNPPSSHPRSVPSRIYTPYMRLMEITAAIKINKEDG
ncbi:myocardial zonula adherens protein-like [Brienomyrus brachyistius]|uniref:myocardial zonula adherens protein-like n=1 Tax=Brienomyrus brachyistius TaxID=42636 RepID=UPI0020B36A8D|nr:myocardial zonula adherens protein-like [Brienomyrus brachyistius]